MWDFLRCMWKEIIVILVVLTLFVAVCGYNWANLGWFSLIAALVITVLTCYGIFSWQFGVGYFRTPRGNYHVRHWLKRLVFGVCFLVLILSSLGILAGRENLKKLQIESVEEVYYEHFASEIDKYGFRIAKTTKMIDETKIRELAVLKEASRKAGNEITGYDQLAELANEDNTYNDFLTRIDSLVSKRDGLEKDLQGMKDYYQKLSAEKKQEEDEQAINNGDTVEELRNQYVSSQGERDNRLAEEVGRRVSDMGDRVSNLLDKAERITQSDDLAAFETEIGRYTDQLGEVDVYPYQREIQSHREKAREALDIAQLNVLETKANALNSSGLYNLTDCQGRLNEISGIKTEVNVLVRISLNMQRARVLGRLAKVEEEVFQRKSVLEDEFEVSELETKVNEIDTDSLNNVSECDELLEQIEDFREQVDLYGANFSDRVDTMRGTLDTREREVNRRKAMIEAKAQLDEIAREVNQIAEKLRDIDDLNSTDCDELLVSISSLRSRLSGAIVYLTGDVKNRAEAILGTLAVYKEKVNQRKRDIESEARHRVDEERTRFEHESQERECQGFEEEALTALNRVSESVSSIEERCRDLTVLSPAGISALQQEVSEIRERLVQAGSNSYLADQQATVSQLNEKLNGLSVSLSAELSSRREQFSALEEENLPSEYWFVQIPGIRPGDLREAPIREYQFCFRDEDEIDFPVRSTLRAGDFADIREFLVDNGRHGANLEMRPINRIRGLVGITFDGVIFIHDDLVKRGLPEARTQGLNIFVVTELHTNRKNEWEPLRLQYMD